MNTRVYYTETPPNIAGNVFFKVNKDDQYVSPSNYKIKHISIGTIPSCRCFCQYNKKYGIKRQGLVVICDQECAKYKQRFKMLGMKIGYIEDDMLMIDKTLVPYYYWYTILGLVWCLQKDGVKVCLKKKK